MATPGIEVAYNRFQETPPNPTLLPSRVGQSQIPGVVPLIREGAPVKSLAFTGRGLTFSTGYWVIPTGMVNMTVRKYGPVPFWGLVRTFHMGLVGTTRTVFSRLCYSDTEDETPRVFNALGGDTPCYGSRNRANGENLLLVNRAEGAWWAVNLNFLLPGPGVYLSFHGAHDGAGDGYVCMLAEVLEVIPEI